VGNATGIKILIGCALFVAAVCVVRSFLPDEPGSNANAVASSVSDPSTYKRREEG
jgi:hypothetical protein